MTMYQRKSNPDKGIVKSHLFSTIFVRKKTLNKINYDAKCFSVYCDFSSENVHASPNN